MTDGSAWLSKFRVDFSVVFGFSGGFDHSKVHQLLLDLGCRWLIARRVDRGR